jgi:hypothetical protein
VAAALSLVALFAVLGAGGLGWIAAGLALGMAAGWPLGAFARGIVPPRALWRLAIFVTIGFALLPLDPNSSLDQLHASDWALPDRVYRLIKPTILWAGLGAVAGLAGAEARARVWGGAAVAGFLLVAPFVAGSLTWADTVEALALLPGLAAGIWMGERTRHSAHLSAEATETHDERIEPPMSLSAPGSDSAHEPAVPGIPAQSKWTRMAGRATGLALVGVTLVSLIDLPEWRIAIALGLAACAAVLMFRPWAGLAIAPAALSLFDLAPWTGRFFWDEFDLLMLVTVAVALWQGQFRLSAFSVRKLGALLGLFVLVWLVSLLLGLLPLQALDANAFSAYWSHYNSLRLAKGLLWGLAFYGLYRSQPENSGAFAKFSTGMALGVLGVSLWSLWEHALFAGTATTADYRVTAGFSSMHTGGGHFEAYLVIALPFVWGLFFSLRNPFYRALAGASFLLGAYAMFFTVARGGGLALGVALLILLPGTWLARRKRAGHRAGFAIPLAMGVVTVVVMVAGVSGVFWKQRIEQTGADAGIRFHHWAEILSLRDSGVMTALFGQGLGTLPATNLASQLPNQAGSYRYVSEGGNTFLALNSAGTLYMAQRVAPHPAETLRLEVSVRAPSTPAGLEASLCEKNLFNSRKCQWLKVDVKTGEQEWQRRTQTLSTGEVGAGNWLTGRPVQFSLYNPVPGTVIQVDNVRLLDARGEDLLKNGDFSKGGDFWFFKSGDHLFWHAKNLWVHLLFEQGWLGTMLFTLMLILALIRLARTVASGELESTVLLASISAWIIVGGVDSLIDAPRIALLVYATLFIGAAWEVMPRTHVKHSRRRRHHTRHRDKTIEPQLQQG